MKKIAYIQPDALIVLLSGNDVICTSGLTKVLDDVSIDDVPSITWKY